MLQELEAFVLIAQEGSFAGAARTLGVVPSTVSKRIAALEERYDVRLVQRTTRALSLTEEGHVLYQQARAILQRVEGLQRSMERLTDEPSGTLVVTTIPSFGQLQLSRMLPRFHRRHPQIRLELRLTDRVVDLVEERCDIAIRFGELPDSDLQSRRLGENLYYLCASPDFLQTYGRPAHPSQLDPRTCFTDRAHPPLRKWVFECESGRVTVVPDGPLQTDDPVARYYATLEGIGVSALPAYVAREAVSRGELEVLFPEQPLRLGSIWALHPSRQHVPARVRAFLDFAVAELAVPSNS